MSDWLIFFWLMFKAALFSTTGTGNLPILYQDLLARSWASEADFAEALAIGQLSPGPSGLWVISMGYLVRGAPGALLTLLAIALPPLAVLLIHGMYRRVAGHPAMQGFIRGLTLAVVGILLAVMAQIMESNGIDLRSIAIVVGAVALGATRRVPVIVVLLLAAVAGVILY